MEYLKLAPDIDSDPAIEAAGWCAARVYELLLKVSAMKDKRGRLERQFQDPAWLAKRWNLTAADLPGVAPEDLIANGLVRLMGVGLVHIDGEDLVLAGWDKYYRPAKTSAERMMEKRNRDAKKSSDARDAGDDTSHHITPPTPLHPPTPQEEAKAPAPFSGEPVSMTTVVPPVSHPDVWGDVEFWVWAQSVRESGGYFAEGRPKKPEVMARWYSQALMCDGVTPAVLKEAFYNFGRSEHWGGAETPYPFAAFMTEWRKFLPPRRNRAAS